ncbi:carboxypeptidase-like regulatory domain-containing protein [Flavobacterium aquatile]|uniref:SpaA-like prealbumin fold domain-containing protein n=1 Tax=Flavobacterium aquatile LMG 4008 = ATCC 11947 TaxID=1453498 RepID=A0A095SQC3_9FLAO|nr:carboxypeptidase-like regulatory domain-containing protein [Flavobacterium aquatile]KGD66772.1 hypothetical protein LG45_15150 [Flavobacterium aquatile LMG 4008 = ATCC 11947]OXA67869.1 hypothetical protein B0A61_05190 [Flavobacterium aquatile LMG 4008 = ATCC 11947]GEC78726.1 hypothetical protein FAQ01_15960 [Flavobacterium aquatile]
MKYYIALFQKIKEHYKTQTSNPNEIALICPSLRVYEDSEMKLMLPQMLIQDELKGEGLLKKQDLSFQLNSLPSSDKYWDINPSNTLFDAYSQIISANQDVAIQDDSTETELAKKVLFDAKGKPTKERKAYDKYLAQFEKLIAEWENHIVAFSGLQTDDEKKIWLEKLNVILQKKEIILADHKLLGFKKTIESALEKINESDDFDRFLSNLKSAKYTLEGSKKTGIVSQDSYLDINFIPYDFMSTDNGWNKLTLSKVELDQLYEAAKTEKNDFPSEIISIDYDEKNITGIELDFSIISMQRNWFSLDPITSSFFKWNEAKSISDGQTISNEFLLSAYPKKMLLIKNLKINIDQAVDASTVSNVNQLIHFGPILMKNQMFINSNSNVKFIKAIRNKEVLQSTNIKNYNNKAVVNATTITPITATISAPIAPIVTAATPITPVTPMQPRVVLHRPITMKPVLDVKPVILNPVLFHPIKIIEINNNLANVIFTVKDKITKIGIYKTEISIMGTNNSVFKEVESDENGTINFQLPIGNYSVEIKKDGYSLLKTTLNIINTNTVNQEHILNPESVTYDTYFLIGMICEKLPKIPT